MAAFDYLDLVPFVQLRAHVIESRGALPERRVEVDAGEARRHAGYAFLLSPDLVEHLPVEIGFKLADRRAGVRDESLVLFELKREEPLGVRERLFSDVVR